jgi:hypothetical protein
MKGVDMTKEKATPPRPIYPRKVFRWNQVAISLNQTEVATLLNALRQGWIMPGKTNDDLMAKLHDALISSGKANDDLMAKLHDALISSGRDPKDFGFGGEECCVGICKPPEVEGGAQ